MPGHDSQNISVGQYLGFSNMGGAEVYAALIANMHADRGCPSHVIVRTEPGPISSRFADDVKVSYLHYTRDSIRQHVAFVRSLFRGYALLRDAIKTQEIQILHTHLPDENLWGLVMSMLKQCRVVITIHNNKFFYDADGTRLGRAVVKFAYKMMVSHCAAVVTCSEEVKNSFVSDLGISPGNARRIHVVNNGVLIPAPASVEARAQTRQSFGIGKDDFWIISAGRLTEAKNLSCLLKSVAMLKDRGLTLRATIGGEGHLRSKLEQEIQALGIADQVSMPGNLDNLQDLMQAADILAMPSLWEGLPLTLLEAMACGLPVVGTSIPGLVDVVTDGQEGFLVPPEDPVAFASALEKMVRNPDERAEMGSRARRLVEKRYSFKRVYAELVEIYRQVMAS